jgi:hypothetical protein
MRLKNSGALLANKAMKRREDIDMKPTSNRYIGKIKTGGPGSALISAAVFFALLLSSVPVALGQAYGVRKTTVVSGPNRTVAASKTTVVAGGRGASHTTVVAGGGHTTVVATGGGLPHGYIAVLPGGYRAVTISGVRYFSVGGVYYRPQIYGGRTVYVVVRL